MIVPKVTMTEEMLVTMLLLATMMVKRMIVVMVIMRMMMVMLMMMLMLVMMMMAAMTKVMILIFESLGATCVYTTSPGKTTQHYVHKKRLPRQPSRTSLNVAVRCGTRARKYLCAMSGLSPRLLRKRFRNRKLKAESSRLFPSEEQQATIRRL